MTERPYISRAEMAARMRWRGVSFRGIARTLDYSSAEDAQRDVEEFEEHRASERQSD